MAPRERGDIVKPLNSSAPEVKGLLPGFPSLVRGGPGEPMGRKALVGSNPTPGAKEPEVLPGYEGK